MRVRLAIGLFVVLTLPAFVGGMVVAKWLLETHPSPVPVILPDRPAAPEGYDYPIPQNYLTSLLRWTDKENVPVWIAARLFAWESGWQASYISRRNDNGTRDLGIAALNTGSLPYFEARFNGGKEIDPFDADTAIRIGVTYLAALYRDTGSWEGSVASYNVGLGSWKAGVRPVRHLRAVLGR